MKDVVIVAASRTAIGIFGGVLAKTPAHVLGATVIKSVLDKSGVDPMSIDEVILGQILTADCGQNPARQAAVAAGIPFTVPSMTINKLCGSGLKSVHMAIQAIRCGDADIIIAGGQENMDLAPHVLPNSREGQRMGSWELKDTLLRDGLLDVFGNYHMGITAENIAEKYGIGREEQDELAALSQQKAVVAQKENRFAEEIVAVKIQQKKQEIIFNSDEGIRADTTTETLAKLRPAFKKDGTVTAGNSSTINDGAAAVMICSAEKAQQLGLKILATVKAYANAGVDPSIMGTGPIPASKKCLARAGWQVGDLDLIEANEAFASQAIAVNREMGWNTDIVNVNGGAIALGHPVGASGCRILVTLIHEMIRRDVHKGLATLCIGGGMGVALAIER